MAQPSSLIMCLAMVVCASAFRAKPQVSLEAEQSNQTEDACGDQVTGATHRECYTRLGIFNTCGDATCKCDADSVITGDDAACDAALYSEGRHFNKEKLSGKGCMCDHKANTMTCSSDAPQVCHQCKFKTKTAKIADLEKCKDRGLEGQDCTANKDEKADETFPIRIGLPAHGLAEEIQGVFWLTDQKTSSSLVSFARSEDGGGFGVVDPSTGVGKVRVSGDRVWSFSDLGGNMDKASGADLVYNFNFDSATKPREARIIPEARNKGNFVNWAVSQSWILEFDMYLLDCKANPDDKNCKDDNYLSGYDESFVWQRRSWAFGIDAGKLVDAAKNYKAVQVIKADGTKLPAYDHWIKYSFSEVTGNTPGEFHYREIDNNIKCD